MARLNIYPDSVKPGIPRLGDLPSKWSRVTFRDFLDIIERPIQPEDNTTYQLVVAKRNRGGIVPRAQLLGKKILTKTQFEIHAGDFLISKRQIIHGACGIVPASLHGAIVSNEYASLLVNGKLDLQYFWYLSHSIHFQQTCFHASVGVDVEKMIFRLSEWLGHEFDLPPLPEQRKIAKILSTWDRAIEITEHLIAGKQHRKKALMQRLLTGKVRFPGFTEPWEDVRLADVADIITGSTPSTQSTEYFGKEYMFASPADLGNSKYIIRTTKYLSRRGSEIGRIIPAGSVLFTCIGSTIGKAAIAGMDLTTNQQINAVCAKAGTINEYLYYYLSKHAPSIKKLASTQAVPIINKTTFGSVTVALPILSEQRKIAEVLSAADRDIEALEQLKTYHQQQKKGLMQQLLTGKRRVKVEEEA